MIVEHTTPYNHDLFRHMAEEHGLTLTDSELHEIALLAAPLAPYDELENSSAFLKRFAEQQLVGIRDALLTLGITGDSLFARIREDLERGMIREARTQLNFVDLIVNSNAQHHAERPKGEKEVSIERR